MSELGPEQISNRAEGPTKHEMYTPGGLSVGNISQQAIFRPKRLRQSSICSQIEHRPDAGKISPGDVIMGGNNQTQTHLTPSGLTRKAPTAFGWINKSRPSLHPAAAGAQKKYDGVIFRTSSNHSKKLIKNSTLELDMAAKLKKKQPTQQQQSAEIELIEQPKFVGKTPKQIMMRNPIFQNMKKYLMKDKEIRKVVTTNKHLNQIIDKIDSLQGLCQPSKARLRTLLTIQEADSGTLIPIGDPLQTDLIFVVSGCLRLRVVNDKGIEFEKEIRRNQYLDHFMLLDLNERKECKRGYKIKALYCGKQDPESVEIQAPGTNMSTMRNDHIKSMRFLRSKQRHSNVNSQMTNRSKEESARIVKASYSSSLKKLKTSGFLGIKQESSSREHEEPQKQVRQPEVYSPTSSSQKSKQELPQAYNVRLGPLSTEDSKDASSPYKKRRDFMINEQINDASFNSRRAKLQQLLDSKEESDDLQDSLSSPEVQGGQKVPIFRKSDSSKKEQSLKQQQTASRVTLPSPSGGFRRISDPKESLAPSSPEHSFQQMLAIARSKHGSDTMDVTTSDSEPCVFVRLPFPHYIKYAYSQIRSSEQMISTLSSVLPYYSEITKTKKFNILNSFEEVEYHGGPSGYKPGTVLERENHPLSYIYLVLQGEILLYKKIKGLYSDDGEKLVKFDQLARLDKFRTPQEQGTEDYGVQIGSIGGEASLFGEESALFKHNSEYTMVSSENLLLFRYEASAALQSWPLDTQRKLRETAFKKYAWIYKNISRIEKKFLTDPNKQVIATAEKVEEKAKESYPLAIMPTMIHFKQSDIALAEDNEVKYLGQQNRRFHNCMKPLEGYVNDETYQRLEHQMNVIFTGQSEEFYIKSKSLTQIRRAEEQEALIKKLCEEEARHSRESSPQVNHQEAMERTLESAYQTIEKSKQVLESKQKLKNYQILEKSNEQTQDSKPEEEFETLNQPKPIHAFSTTEISSALKNFQNARTSAGFVRKRRNAGLGEVKGKRGQKMFSLTSENSSLKRNCLNHILSMKGGETLAQCKSNTSHTRPTSSTGAKSQVMHIAQSFTKLGTKKSKPTLKGEPLLQEKFSRALKVRNSQFFIKENQTPLKQVQQRKTSQQMVTSDKNVSQLHATTVDDSTMASFYRDRRTIKTTFPNFRKASMMDPGTLMQSAIPSQWASHEQSQDPSTHTFYGEQKVGSFVVSNMNTIGSMLSPQSISEAAQGTPGGQGGSTAISGQGVPNSGHKKPFRIVGAERVIKDSEADKQQVTFNSQLVMSPAQASLSGGAGAGSFSTHNPTKHMNKTEDSFQEEFNLKHLYGKEPSTTKGADISKFRRPEQIDELVEKFSQNEVSKYLKGDTFFSSLAEQLEPQATTTSHHHTQEIQYQSKEQRELGFDSTSLGFFQGDRLKEGAYLPSYQFAKQPMKLSRHGGGFAVLNQQQLLLNKVLNLAGKKHLQRQMKTSSRMRSHVKRSPPMHNPNAKISGFSQTQKSSNLVSRHLSSRGADEGTIDGHTNQQSQMLEFSQLQQPILIKDKMRKEPRTQRGSVGGRSMFRKNKPSLGASSLLNQISIQQSNSSSKQSRINLNRMIQNYQEQQKNPGNGRTLMNKYFEQGEALTNEFLSSPEPLYFDQSLHEHFKNTMGV